tara:strand:+ start:339 stop:662 length:324 start_codon:yes stop_codon:yes gene_type:complete
VLYAVLLITKNDIMNWITIFKREKRNKVMPEPKFEDNWKAECYEENVKQGVRSLQQGKSIKIMDDGRGYELALEIKHRFILEYQKQMAEKIKINGGTEITVSFTNSI